MNVRIFQDQAERLKKSGQGAAIIRYAYARYKRGDFGRICGTKNKKKKKSGNVPLASYAVRQRLPVRDAVLREILSRHFSIPDTIRQREIQAEIKRLDADIEEMFAVYGAVKYFEEKAET